VTHTPHPDAIARAIAEKVDHLDVAGVGVAIRWHLFGRLEAIAHDEGTPLCHYRVTCTPWDDVHGVHGYVADQATLDATGTTVTLSGGPWRRGRVEDSRALDVISQPEPPAGMCLIVRDLSNLWLVPQPVYLDLLTQWNSHHGDEVTS
jgi:hypothetical protein